MYSMHNVICYPFQFQVNCNISTSNAILTNVNRRMYVIRKVVCCLKWNFSSGTSLMHFFDVIIDSFFLPLWNILQPKFLEKWVNKSLGVLFFKKIHILDCNKVSTDEERIDNNSLSVYFSSHQNSVWRETIQFIVFMQQIWNNLHLNNDFTMNILIHFAQGTRNHISHFWWSKK